MAGLRFGQTDHLLCHDDELEGRRIAYIVYLVPEDWEEADGGTLDLFAVDDKLQPTRVVKRLVPAWNSFSFFEVSPVSYHQVAEVISADKTRVSISGWFHGAPIARPPHPSEAPLFQYHGHIGPAAKEIEEIVEKDFSLLAAWINPVYILRKAQEKVRGVFSGKAFAYLSPDSESVWKAELC